MSTATAAHPFAPRLKKPLIVAGVLSALALTIAALWWWGSTKEREAISELAPAERHALYERTLQNLSTTCQPATRPSGLDDYCRRQADFILLFPECDSACASLAKQQAIRPSR